MKDPGAGKNRRQKGKGVAGDEMVRQHHQLNGHEFEQTLGNSWASLRAQLVKNLLAKLWFFQ